MDILGEVKLLSSYHDTAAPKTYCQGGVTFVVEPGLAGMWDGEAEVYSWRCRRLVSYFYIVNTSTPSTSIFRSTFGLHLHRQPLPLSAFKLLSLSPYQAQTSTISKLVHDLTSFHLDLTTNSAQYDDRPQTNLRSSSRQRSPTRSSIPPASPPSTQTTQGPQARSRWCSRRTSRFES